MTLKVDEIQDTSGNDVTLTKQRAAKHWVNISDSASVRGSFNTSSTTDVNSGNFDYSFTNNMANNDYCCNAQNGHSGDNTGPRRVRVMPYHPLTSGYSTHGENYGDNNAGDPETTQNQVMGDLA